MDIEIFKFGGASVKSAAGVSNVFSILEKFSDKKIIVVISAMGKTTNNLETLLHHYLAVDAIPMVESYHEIRKFHFDIVEELFPGSAEDDFPELISLFEQLRGYLRKGHTVSGEMKDYNFEYDQIVSYGEMFSSEILSSYIKKMHVGCELTDVRELIKTDNTFRNGRVDWDLTSDLINKKITSIFSDKGNTSVIVTQGFIGSDPEGNTTTLGREGSDYTAAIFAYSLKAPEMTIWKDVPGVMNADPKWFSDARKLDTISYREAIELAYFGASVIHPKTIKPLENGNIILRVKSFNDPDDKGTVISNPDTWKVEFPVYIRKYNQVLISISPKDFSFIIEESLSRIFDILARHGIKVNVMQNSAISFSICVDNDPNLETGCIPALQEEYHVKYNKDLELFTIRHYTQEAISEITSGKNILLEQRTRNTVHLVLDT